MSIINIIKGKNTIYDFLLDAYDNSDYQRGYYLIELMIKCNVNLDHFVKFLSKNRSIELHKGISNHQFYRKVFAKFIRQCRMAKK